MNKLEIYLKGTDEVRGSELKIDQYSIVYGAGIKRRCGCQQYGKKFRAAAAPRGNAVALNRRPRRALCIERQLSYFGNAAFPVWGFSALGPQRSHIYVREQRRTTF